MGFEYVDRPLQTALLDANGDGQSGKEDEELVRDFIIGRGWFAGPVPPVIGEVSEEQVLSETFEASIWASNIVSLNGIDRVWAVIVPPDFDNASGAEVTEQDMVELTDPDQDGVYTGAYHRFFRPGTYGVFVYASDAFEVFSLPAITTVVVDDPIWQGPSTSIPAATAASATILATIIFNRDFAKTGGPLFDRNRAGRLSGGFDGRMRLPLHLVGRIRQLLSKPKRNNRDHRKSDHSKRHAGDRKSCSHRSMNPADSRVPKFDRIERGENHVGFGFDVGQATPSFGRRGQVLRNSDNLSLYRQKKHRFFICLNRFLFGADSIIQKLQRIIDRQSKYFPTPAYLL